MGNEPTEIIRHDLDMMELVLSLQWLKRQDMSERQRRSLALAYMLHYVNSTSPALALSDLMQPLILLQAELQMPSDRGSTLKIAEIAVRVYALAAVVVLRANGERATPARQAVADVLTSEGWPAGISDIEQWTHVWLPTKGGEGEARVQAAARTMANWVPPGRDQMTPAAERATDLLRRRIRDYGEKN
ncbi:hypothetical protein CLV78_10213 [Aliiruegeria haliotis]|uniref:Uncharacterized protein n=1 Tax=Aliiruegeria haliotis TaxID=1280846 RepID=A0A2T0RUW3_9RHOB|nr:hypothetical protein [Aliiruegeria haliotis]PRY24843.1 hypothetical protein CLV78_10213 [Aliiruegeria haliotis]